MDKRFRRRASKSIRPLWALFRDRPAVLRTPQRRPVRKLRFRRSTAPLRGHLSASLAVSRDRLRQQYGFLQSSFRSLWAASRPRTSCRSCPRPLSTLQHLRPASRRCLRLCLTYCLRHQARPPFQRSAVRCHCKSPQPPLQL